MSRGTFGRKQFFWKIYKFDQKVCTLSKKKSDFSRKIETELSKHLFLCPGKPWRKTSLPGKIIYSFNFFGLWAREKSDFCLELSAWVPELNSLSPQEQFDQNLNFLEKNYISFHQCGPSNWSIHILAFKLLQACQKSKSRVHWNLFSKDAVFFQKFVIFLLHFQFWLKQFGVSETIAESFSKLFLRVHINHSWRFCINEKRVTFSDDFGIWETRLWTFAIFAKK